MNDYSALWLFLKSNWAESSLAIGAVATYLVSRKKREREDKKLVNEITTGELDNVQGALKIYRTMLDDLKVQLDAVNLAYYQLDKKFMLAITKLEVSEKKIASLDKENKRLIKVINSCEFSCNIKEKISREKTTTNL